MRVCSYLIHPKPETHQEVTDSLNSIEGCTAVPSDDGKMVILLTETASKDEETAVLKRVNETPNIDAMTLTFGELSPETQKDKAS